jgi:hypothetical protein
MPRTLSLPVVSMHLPPAVQQELKEWRSLLNRFVLPRVDWFISVYEYDATGDGVTNDTNAIRAAIAAGMAKGVAVLFPPGTYLVTDELLITANRTNLIFSGKQRTKFLFRPASGGKACFNFEHEDNEVLYQCSMRGGLTVYSDNTSLEKIALRVTDISQFYCEELAVGPIGAFTGDSSIGIQTRGREFGEFVRYSLAADIPISIENNPNSTLDCDHFTFAHGDCFPLDGNPNVLVEDGVYLSNLAMKEQGWVGGSDGLVFNDTTSATVSHGIRLEDIRWEQMSGTTGYMVRLNFSGGSSGAAQGVTLRNIYGGLTARGFYLRKCLNVLLDSTQYVGDGIAIDADDTCFLADRLDDHDDRPRAGLWFGRGVGRSGGWRVGRALAKSRPRPPSFPVVRHQHDRRRRVTGRCRIVPAATARRGAQGRANTGIGQWRLGSRGRLVDVGWRNRKENCRHGEHGRHQFGKQPVRVQRFGHANGVEQSWGDG